MSSQDDTYEEIWTMLVPLALSTIRSLQSNLRKLANPRRHHRQKLVLIEGAPGVGKTTFSWEFCRKWGKGEILQDHSLLLLLPLRDNNLKEAKTLSDLFYHPNSELQQAVVQEVTSNQGQGVAIWLEAWDELDHEPREKASVFLDLIHGRILPLQLCLSRADPGPVSTLERTVDIESCPACGGPDICKRPD